MVPLLLIRMEEQVHTLIYGIQDQPTILYQELPLEIIQ